jgi:hypothetical protein
LVASGDSEPSRSVLPSGADLTTSMVPMMPLPPALLSTTMVWPRLVVRYGAITRVT